MEAYFKRLATSLDPRPKGGASAFTSFGTPSNTHSPHGLTWNDRSRIVTHARERRVVGWSATQLH